MNLTLIVTAVDDMRLPDTIASARATAPNIEILVIDDCSGAPTTTAFPDLQARVVRNDHRCGVGPSRSLGIALAKNEAVAFCDSHMKFEMGWAEETIARLSRNPASVYCYKCYGLDRSHPEISVAKSQYFGAQINLCGPDANDATKLQVLEAVWRKSPPADDSELGAIMGGCYACTRKWFQHIDPLKLLRIWGQDEIQLSLKSYLAGGDCRLISSVGVGHIFGETVVRPSGKILEMERKPYDVPMGFPTWNKMLSIGTLIPFPMADLLMEKLSTTVEAREWNVAMDIWRRDYHLVIAERARNREIFTRTFAEYCERFGIKL